MMEKEIKEKKSNGSKVVIFILVVLLLGACTYIAYDKLMVKEDILNNNVQENKKIKEENLDVNSRLVMDLYLSVTSNDDSVFKYWMYDTDNFNVDNATEESKLKIVGINLNETKSTLYSCDDSSIPERLNDNYINVCVANKEWQANYSAIAYNKKYVESLYKKIYGNDAKLDTSVDIYSTSLGARFHYIKQLDQYVLYMVMNDGTSCGTLKSSIVKATKTDDILKIYEAVDKYECGEETKSDTTSYVYTFKLDEDGMYNFISRVKE